jgi:hypothetical protein
MLWSDPKNEPPKELNDTESMMHRAGIVIAVVIVLAMIVLGLR